MPIFDIHVKAQAIVQSLSALQPIPAPKSFWAWFLDLMQVASGMAGGAALIWTICDRRRDRIISPHIYAMDTGRLQFGNIGGSRACNVKVRALPFTIHWDKVDDKFKVGSEQPIGSWMTIPDLPVREEIQALKFDDKFSETVKCAGQELAKKYEGQYKQVGYSLEVPIEIEWTDAHGIRNGTFEFLATGTGSVSIYANGPRGSFAMADDKGVKFTRVVKQSGVNQAMCQLRHPFRRR